MIATKLRTAADAKVILKNARKMFFHMQKQQQNVREGNFLFPKLQHSHFSKQCRQNRDIRADWKIILYVISQS